VASKLQIISNSQVLLGNPIVTNLNPTSTNELLLAVQDIYDLIVPELFSSFPWRFGMAVHELPQLADPPPLECQYQFAYQLPPQCVRIFRTVPNNRFRIFQTQLWSNCEPLKLVCVVEVPEADWPSYFESAVTYGLSARTAMAVTNNENMFQIMDGQFKQQLVLAKSRDSQQQPGIPMQDDVLTAAHFGSDFGFVDFL